MRFIDLSMPAARIATWLAHAAAGTALAAAVFACCAVAQEAPETEPDLPAYLEPDDDPAVDQTYEYLPSGTTSTGTYIRQARDVYHVYVFGDSFGDGLWAGLMRQIGHDQRFRIVRRSKAGTGFVREEVYDWNEAITGILDINRVDIALVMIGANDARAFQTADGEVEPGTPEWERLYADRIDRFLKPLREHGAAVYWVGLPVMRKPAYDETIARITEIQRQRVELAGMKFIATRPQFADETGAYTDSGTDVDGEQRRLRSRDGVHFLKSGNQRLAKLVYDVVRVDIDEVEQLEDSDEEGADVQVSREDGVTVAPLPDVAAGSTTAGEDPVTVPRDAVEAGSGAVTREFPPESAFVDADALREGGSAAGRGGILAAIDGIDRDSPAGRALIIGEPVEPKPGRADDFAWPAE